MNRRLLIVAGAFLAVAGFGATRWVEADMAVVGSDAGTWKFRIDRWELGPEIDNTPEPPAVPTGDIMVDRPDLFPLKGRKELRGTPRNLIAGIGWGVSGLGAAMLALGLTSARLSSARLES